jgi:hypothetical protein
MVASSSAPKSMTTAPTYRRPSPTLNQFTALISIRDTTGAPSMIRMIRLKGSPQHEGSELDPQPASAREGISRKASGKNAAISANRLNMAQRPKMRTCVIQECIVMLTEEGNKRLECRCASQPQGYKKNNRNVSL